MVDYAMLVTEPELNAAATVRIIVISVSVVVAIIRARSIVSVVISTIIVGISAVVVSRLVIVARRGIRPHALKIINLAGAPIDR